MTTKYYRNTAFPDGWYEVRGRDYRWINDRTRALVSEWVTMGWDYPWDDNPNTSAMSDVEVAKLMMGIPESGE